MIVIFYKIFLIKEGIVLKMISCDYFLYRFTNIQSPTTITTTATTVNTYVSLDTHLEETNENFRENNEISSNTIEFDEIEISSNLSEHFSNSSEIKLENISDEDESKFKDILNESFSEKMKNDEIFECSICRDDENISSEKMKIMECCLNYICQICYQKQINLQTVCPFCRKDIDKLFKTNRLMAEITADNFYSDSFYLDNENQEVNLEYENQEANFEYENMEEILEKFYSEEYHQNEYNETIKYVFKILTANDFDFSNFYNIKELFLYIISNFYSSKKTFIWNIFDKKIKIEKILEKNIEDFTFINDFSYLYIDISLNKSYLLFEEYSFYMIQLFEKIIEKHLDHDICFEEFISNFFFDKNLNTIILLPDYFYNGI